MIQLQDKIKEFRVRFILNEENKGKMQIFETIKDLVRNRFINLSDFGQIEVV